MHRWLVLLPAGPNDQSLQIDVATGHCTKTVASQSDCHPGNTLPRDMME
jgi:hypothetical protein